MCAKVTGVYINADAYQVCLDHAFSTEREEVMGLLMGELDNDDIVQISAMIMMRRSDKRKDRVEISPEQLMKAAECAETLSHELNRPMRVVGWYHSHPHITVLPSAVDCRTQSQYQMMDNRFVGLIFSVFPGESCKPEDQNLQVICFQSDGERVEVEMHVVPSGDSQPFFSEKVLDLPNILYDEEHEQYDAHRSQRGLSTLSSAHNASVFTTSLFHVMSLVESSLLQGLQQRHGILLQNAEIDQEELEMEHEELQELEAHIQGHMLKTLHNGVR